MSHDILLEIGVEELPARFVEPSLNQLQEKANKWLTAARIEFAEIQAFATPRRLAIWIKEVAKSQADVSEDVKGPAKKIALDSEGAWTQAALGFARSQGVTPADLFFRELNQVEYVYARKESKGRATADLAADFLKELTLSLQFPKNMRWGTGDLRYARPIRWIVALLDEQTIDFSVAGVQTSAVSRGHRFLGNEITISHPERYATELAQQFVMVGMDERRATIMKQIEDLAAEHQWQVPIDEDLLAEVTSLVEYPTVLFGQFSEEFLNIPQQVLITSMREHQRYFPVLDQGGKMQPYFITIRNGDERSLKQVAKGNEKVLRARLSDARFFYSEDQKITIAQALAKLEKIVYQEELGTVADKVRRIVENANRLAHLLQVDSETTDLVARAASICKFDLITQMVYEFPELQGVMGEDYALKLNEHHRVAQAIKEHYQPRFSGDQSPSDLVGVVVSIADKLDTLIGCFSLGLIPTGSQDPYALRRQTAGIVQMIDDHQLSCTISQLVAIAIQSYGPKRPQKRSESQLLQDVTEFFGLRLKNAFAERNVRYDVVDAVMLSGYEDLRGTLLRGTALMKIVQLDTFKAVCESLMRVVNIANKYESEKLDVNPQFFQDEVEANLFAAWSNRREQLRLAFESNDFASYFAILAELTEPITQFFERVMVMVDDESVRHNRLKLLRGIANDVQSVADLAKIVW